MKVFLKFNREDDYSKICLIHWLEIFKDYEIFILTDLFDVSLKKNIPAFLKTVSSLYSTKLINSDYSIAPTYFKCIKGAKHRMASANMTCFQHLENSAAFWIIDADDTMFLYANYELIRDKIKLAETYFFENKLDGFSLDFYRNMNNGWTFGVCLLNSNTSWKSVASLTSDEIAETGLARNIDTAFHVLWKKNVLKLANFVFNDCAFQHIANNYPDMPHGIYSWTNNTLWNSPLQQDVIII